jgi:hypothetical protein
MGTVLILVDGKQTELELSDHMAPADVNARLRAAGVPEQVRALTPEEVAEADRRRDAYMREVAAEEQAELERLALVFLEAGHKAAGETFTRDMWNAMPDADKRAALAGIKAVLDSVRGGIEDE